MTDLLGGNIFIDEHYHSGIEGYPGTRFVIDLQVPPHELSMEIDALMSYYRGTGGEQGGCSSTGTTSDSGGSFRTRLTHHSILEEDEDEDTDDDDDENDNDNYNNNNHTNESKEQEPRHQEEAELPQECKVLFVDDDLILRKLFARSVKRVAPTWKINEAANGESALIMVEQESFDFIFMDQYMASVQKQLLGSETVRAMRTKGIKSIICGLSANDCETIFYQAGADAFLFKPFPCEKETLRQELLRIASLNNSNDNNKKEEDGVV
eukprot:CAMPEP_0118686328 /NCGR_PEP_ID=MMETSP0800-20121206/7749_1 /TAXON_ID=210618 ORGANISM="Striatella unipunctata, Strain CCMP2910" /NCGR_SAMPLE_ID=MMETSP0800 /ASSEMBLY_ACC=CAM_ASM_000638 /LENGTH=265 /DNA_ID=CAMNT_0006583355 /DNA_START=234 /DNA_END=1031 /DNA_ORIENTATION=-